MKRLSHTKRLTLGLGIIAVGVLVALPFRRQVPPDTALTTSSASNQLSLGEGVSLQMPGQTPTTPLSTTPPAPWPTASEESAAHTAGEPASDTGFGEQIKPPALADQYHPLFTPAAAADSSGRVVAPQGPPPLPRKPPRKHTIHDGDTLESLAVRYLGDARRAAEILAANRDVLADPELLPIGVSITIPHDAAAMARDSAADEDGLPLVPLPTSGFRRGS